MARFSPGPPPGSERALWALARAAFALAATLIVLLIVLYSGYLGYTDLDAPAGVELAPVRPEVEPTGRVVRHGRSRLARDGRLWDLYLAGPPVAMGQAHGDLLARSFHELHTRLLERLRARYPTASEAWGANMLARWRYRGADASWDPALRRELAALAASLPEARTGRYSAYHTLFLYQCFQELTQRLDDVVIEGTAFAVAPRTTGRAAEGNLILGRSFYLDLGDDDAIDRVVAFVHPDGKYPFASVGWAGLLGVVTGVNSRGIFVALNAARTDDPPEEGLPLPLVLRQVLEEADTLERAIAIMKAAPIRTSGLVLVGDGASRRAVVVELAARGPKERRVVRGEDEPVVWVTDHMLADVFADDPFNDKIRRDTSSGARYERLRELLPRPGPMTPSEAVSILRDRRGTGGKELGLGNRNALDNLRIMHSVVVDATAMILWVGEGPSTLGSYRAYDLRARLGRDDARPAAVEDLAPDPLLFSAEYQDYRQALAAAEHARAMLAMGEPERARWSAAIGLALAPELGDLHRVMGDVGRALGDVDLAREHYTRYLELSPGRLRDHELVRGILNELGAAPAGE